MQGAFFLFFLFCLKKKRRTAVRLYGGMIIFGGNFKKPCAMKNDELFKNRYRIPSNRWSGWSYDAEAAYFITICTYHRECLFGNIVDSEMILNDCGLIVQREWEYSAQLRPEIILGNYIIMPNHFHAIVHIIPPSVETHGGASHPHPHPNPQPILHRPPKSIPSLIAGFKSVVTRQINILHGTSGEKIWQSNYYDHIIRNNEEYQRIDDYILMNPERWQSDSLRR